MFDINKLNSDLWLALDNNKDFFKQELYRELCEEHILYGIQVKELARREDRDDVLFLLLDSSNRYAVVHLTWTGKEEKNSYFPATRLYSNFTDVINANNY
ncbi:MAG: hypothetical protein H6Q73_2754 [Firmicutes bacterium]|nr:hypothetical protein [Bacillota bacterium]